MHMWKRGIALLLTLILLVGATGCGEQEDSEKAEQGDVTQDVASYEEVGEICADFYDTYGVAGLCVGVYDNGEVSYFNFGKTDWGAEDITENTLFELASITKSFVGILMAEMNADPSLDFDYTKPVEQYVDFRIPEKNGVKPLVWHLATHASGMSRLPDNLFTEDPYRYYDVERMREYFATAELNTVPGEKYAYSNLAMGLLGVALADVAGMDDLDVEGLEALLRERVLDPLGMEDTCILLTEEQYAAIAKPHKASGERAILWGREDSAIAGSGAMKSTASDMIKYIAACVGDTELPETLAQGIDDACTVHFVDGSTKMGFGFSENQLPDGSVYYAKDGGSSGTNTYVAFCRDTGIGVIVLCNSKKTVSSLGKEILEAVQTLQGEKADELPSLTDENEQENLPGHTEEPESSPADESVSGDELSGAVQAGPADGEKESGEQEGEALSKSSDAESAEGS